MRLHTLIIATAIAALAAGCASVAVTDDAIATNTAFALGVEKSSVEISNRENSGIKTTYTAKTRNGNRYSCYVTGTVSVVGRVVSDAMCSPLGKAPQGATLPSATDAGSCNALLRAAGRCK